MASRRRKLADRIVAQIALLRARRLVARAPIGALTQRRRAEQHAASEAASLAGASTRVAAAEQRARELADAVRWTALHGLFRPFCLVQSLAIQELLSSAGISDSEIRVGVRREGNALKAHAWVKWHDIVLGDDPAYVSRFTEVDDIGVLGLQR
jgi:hypothetical protein